MAFDINKATPEQIKARLAELEAQVARKATLSCKVSEKGGVSVYGLGRFPVTLYFEQWERLLAAADMIRKFIADNKSSLTTKANPQVPASK